MRSMIWKADLESWCSHTLCSDTFPMNTLNPTLHYWQIERKIKICFLFNYVYVCEFVRVSLYGCMQVLEEARRGLQIPWSRVPGNCELPEVGAGNGTQVLWKSLTNSEPLSHLSQPQTVWGFNQQRFYKTKRPPWLLLWMMLRKGSQKLLLKGEDSSSLWVQNSATSSSGCDLCPRLWISVTPQL